MKMVARLPEGVPTEFRRKLWLTLAEKYLSHRGVDWKKAERTCFNEWSNPDDDELGLQIVRVNTKSGFPLILALKCLFFLGFASYRMQFVLWRGCSRQSTDVEKGVVSVRSVEQIHRLLSRL